MAADKVQAKPGWKTTFRALGHRKTRFMAIFGFAAGLDPKSKDMM